MKSEIKPKTTVYAVCVFTNRVKSFLSESKHLKLWEKPAAILQQNQGQSRYQETTASTFINRGEFKSPDSTKTKTQHCWKENEFKKQKL